MLSYGYLVLNILKIFLKQRNSIHFAGSTLIIQSKQHFNWPQCLWGKAMCMHSQYVALSHSCLLSCLGWLDWLGLGSLPACLPACLCVFMSCSCTTTTSLLLPSCEGYEKSRSLNNIAGIAGNTLRVSPVTTPYGSPCPLRRSRSPIPSILWDVQLLATPLQTISIFVLSMWTLDIVMRWSVAFAGWPTFEKMDKCVDVCSL